MFYLEHASHVLSRALQKCMHTYTLTNRKVGKMSLNVVVMVSFHKVNSEAQHDTGVLSSPNGVFLSLLSGYNDRIS